MDSIPQQLIFTAASLVCAGVGSFHDVRKHRIPNLLTGPAILAGLATHAVSHGWPGLADAALAGLIAGGIFFLFFLVGGMGGGDVKLMTAVGCFTGLAPLRLVVLSTVVAGALFALAMGTYKGRLRETLRNVAALLAHHLRQGLKPHAELNLANRSTLRLPFALPIAVGCLVALCAQGWGLRP